MASEVGIYDTELNDSDKELEDLLEEYNSTKKSTSEVKGYRKHSPVIKDVIEDDEDNVDLSVPMDKVLFGDKNQLLDNLSKAIRDKKSKVEDDEEDSDDEAGDGKEAKRRKPAWTDTDDAELLVANATNEHWQRKQLIPSIKEKSYKEYLTAKFTRLTNQPKWAQLGKQRKRKSSTDDLELLGTVGLLQKSSGNETSHLLPSKTIALHRLKDLNRDTYAEGHINSIQFHPHSTVALVAGDKNIATLYAIDGVQNEKLHNIQIRGFPMKCVRILPCGTKAILGSTTRYGYVYDLLAAKDICYRLRKNNGSLENFVVSACGRFLVSAGKCGEIHLYESKSFELIRTMRQRDEVAGLCFTADSNQLICSSKNTPNVYVFNMRERQQEHLFTDYGCVKGSVVAMAPNQRLFATGTSEGVVNVYDYQKVLSSANPTPEKCFMNLRTCVNSLQFNHTSEIMAFASSLVPDAVKLAHFPTGTVFSNFPVSHQSLGVVRTLNFSPHSAFFAMGTKREAPLLRLKHFPNY